MAEILYGLQERVAAGIRHKDHHVRPFCDLLRTRQVGSLAELDVCGLGKMNAALAKGFLKHVVRLGMSPETERHKDTWDGAAFGMTGYLHFEKITQPWLRKATQDWAVDDAPRRRGTNPHGAMQTQINCVVRLSENLRLNRPDKGMDPRLLGRDDIVAFLNRMRYLVQRGEVAAARHVVDVRHLRRMLLRMRSLGLTQLGWPLHGLSEQFTLRPEDIPDDPEDSEAGRDLPPEVNTTTPTLRDTFVDADGDKVNGTFQIYDNATNTQVGDVIVSKYVPSGQVASVIVPSGVLANGKTYKFRTSPYDGSHYNNGWSAWKTFTVDTAAPSAPTGITSTDYPSNAWVKGAGQAGTFSVTPPASDHNWLEWSLDGVTWAKVATGGSSAAKAISIAPPEDGTHTLQVRQVDKADNKSEAIEYTFHAGPGGFVQPDDGERTARRLPLVAEADGSKYNEVSFSWRRSEADPWVRIPAGDVTAGGTPLTSWPVPLVSGRNAALVWNATDTVNPDGTVEIKADFTGPNSASGSTRSIDVIVDRNATGAAAEEVGPGELNLLTGDYTLSAEDVSSFGLSMSRTVSSRTPDKGAQQDGQAAIFGKEWVSGAVAEATESDYSHIRRISDTAVAVVDVEGTETHFTADAAETGWVPETGSEYLTLTGSVTGSFTLSDTDGTVTAFTKPDAASATWQVSSTLMDGLSNSTTTVVSETVTVDGEELARPKRIIAPTSAASAATCTTTPSTKGCRSLEFVYAASTTATATEFGDFVRQVKEIRLWSTEPGAASASAKAVQSYAYDTAGRLRQVWNPQISPALKTEYAYDTAGRVTGLTPAGELPWTFTYGKVGNAATAGDGMLLKVSRSGLQQGTKDVVSGTASTSVVYDVPLTGTAAPYAMSAAEVKKWGQLDAPTDATAVFPADVVPASHDGSALTAAGYARATISYLGVSGREVNTAAPGGHISTTEYDRFGNTVRELSAGNRAVALGLSAADQAVQADLGITSMSAAERANLLAATSLYDETGIRELEKLGPLRRIDLTADLKSGSTTLVPAGSPVTARSWVINEYGTGRPTDGTATVRDQLTKSTVGAQVREHPTVHGETKVSQVLL
ncbi:putative YD repeat-containing protein [Streptomyces viridochromogenes Tue57]|uniref:Putative YD repeat-containing protein n=1 Tax=Streptomyces viridochromogenes Tue57 TaxID=1160705 RepID=L8PSA0_STRVR|nr:putative YD repeat-containing protein [Streptomyces viridochromogenes Tue57]